MKLASSRAVQMAGGLRVIAHDRNGSRLANGQTTASLRETPQAIGPKRGFQLPPSYFFFGFFTILPD